MAKRSIRGLSVLVTGMTPDGRSVLSGLFPLVGTHGLPLDLLVEELDEQGYVIDMPDFVSSARVDGWKDKTLLAKFRETRLGLDEGFMSALEGYLRRSSH